MAMDENRDVIFEITEEIGVITEHPTGWNKEINMVSWNGGSPKYDIRDWSPDHMKMGRGITLHEMEMRQILNLMKRRPRTGAVSRPERRADPVPDPAPARDPVPDGDPAFMSAGEEAEDNFDAPAAAEA